MQTCRAKRGFFSLRDCGETSAKQCALCGRPVCSHHLSPQSGFSRCLDCEGRAGEKDVLTTPGPKKKDAPPPPPPDQPITDPAWSYRYRDRYYSQMHYAPLYAGLYYDSYYDRYDTRSFDSGMASSGPSSSSWGDSDSGPGIGDS
jgi:hypothetical protein